MGSSIEKYKKLNIYEISANLAPRLHIRVQVSQKNNNCKIERHRRLKTEILQNIQSGTSDNTKIKFNLTFMCPCIVIIF